MKFYTSGAAIGGERGGLFFIFSGSRVFMCIKFDDFSHLTELNWDLRSALPLSFAATFVLRRSFTSYLMDPTSPRGAFIIYTYFIQLKKKKKKSCMVNLVDL